MRILLLILAACAIPAHADEVDGRLQWSRRTELAMPVSGVVATVPASAGERVAKGAVLLTLDGTPFAAAVHEAEARLAARKVEQREATRDARQAQELYDRTVLSTVELENAKNKLARAEAGLKEASAELARARYLQSVSTLRAPFDAVILSRHAEPGQSIAAELKPPVLFVVAAAGEYSVQARVTADRAAGLKVGQEVAVKVGGHSLPARLRAISHEPAGGTEPFVIEAGFATSEALAAGQSARIVLP